jgi:antitoxin (DNA-binding transcriptional repressor) of toxin-antitoxin stability system
MERIGTRELRRGLAGALRRAPAGERLVVTVDGRPVAQLGPLESDETATIDDLVARGLLLAARRDDRPGPSMVMPVWAGTRLDQLVREVRGR